MHYTTLFQPLARTALLLTLLLGQSAWADSKAVIDAGTSRALIELREHSDHASELLDKAAGVLVFHDVVKMGFGVGGQYGEGELLIKGAPVAYYSTVGASFGLQIGAQIKTEVILFMTPEALKSFRESQGWEVGVDASVAVINLGGGKDVNTRNIKEPVIGFIFSNRGLMYNLTFEGSKITRLAR
jgi:lipid-binding SYLF domain-containing protein